MKTARFLLLALAFLSETAIAQFNDQGLINARVRTDYNSQTEGQPSNPITYVNPCLFPTAVCGNSPTTFSATNWFAQNVSGYPQSSFWVLDLNNEFSYNLGSHTTYNPGPPNQSVPRSAPGYGLMGFTALIDSEAGENFYRAHLVANGSFPNPNGGLGIPYLGIGAERYRGNNSVAPGILNTATGRKRVQFKAKLWNAIPPGPAGHAPTLAFYVTARTAWGGKARGLQITLYRWGFENSTIPPALERFVTQYQWNWPMQESFYHPGVEWAFMDAEDVQYFCGFSVPPLTTIGQQISYDINLQSLFQCLSNRNAWDTPMPSSTLYIQGVHWAVEMSGANGAIWTSVHDMKMVQ
jgi:hypothetical protein